MELDIIISGSRFGKERDIIIETLRQYTQANVYDCNEYPTDIIREGKQGEIDSFIRRCDWYILVASTDTYGRFTFEEWETITDCMKQKSREQMVTIIRCENVSQSVKEQKICDKGKYTFDDFEKRLTSQGFSPKNFYATYKYDKDFRSLRETISKELDNAINKNLVLRKYSTPLYRMTAKQVFANQYRTEASNGFVEDMYLRRSTLDDELEYNNNFAIVTGAPASGKTRAVYEYLKRRAQAEPEARMLAIDNRNLAETVQSLESYQKWHHTLIDGKTQDLSGYYFVCDQVNDMLYTETNIGLFAKLHKIAVEQFNAHLLCTALTESYRLMTTQPQWEQEFKAYQYTEIAIRKLQEEPSEFVMELKELMTDDDSPSASQRKKEVIGDYIKGLVDYNESIKNAVNEYSKQHNGIIEDFVKAYHTIRIFRRGNTIPFGLVVTVLEQIAGKTFDTEYFNELRAFFSRYNILSIYSTKTISKLPHISNELFEYDNEWLRMRYPANFLIRIDNDYIWNILYEQYAYNVDKPDDMDMCMWAYSEAFLKEAPLSTLRRIIARSPSVVLSLVYDAHPDNVRRFVMEKLEDVCKDENLWENHTRELCLLIAHVLHRSKNMEEFKNDFDVIMQWTAGRFLLTEDVVAELMGIGVQRSFIIKKQVKDFLVSKGWEFNTHIGTSLYYHSRMIQYLQSFVEVKAYMETNVLQPKVYENQHDEPDLVEINKQSMLRSLLVFCQNKDQLASVLEWSMQMKVRINRDMIYRLCEVVKKTPQLQYPQENALVLDTLHNFFSRVSITDVSNELLYYYLTDMAGCFQNALVWYLKGEKLLQRIPALQKRAISSMLNRSRPDEFCLIYRYFFKDGKLIKKLPQVSRNLLIKRMNFSDGIALMEQLFNRLDADSIPDVNTLISLLTGLDVNKYAYQSLLQMLSHPLLQGIHYNESLICMMLQYCDGETQEDYIIKHFIKPDRYQYLKTKYGQTKNETQLKQEVENYWYNLTLDPRIATTRVRNRYNRDFDKIETYVLKTINHMLSQNKAIDSSLLNNTFSKLIYLYEHAYISKEKFQAYRKQLSDYLEQKISIQDNADGTFRKRIDLLIKDEFFYSSYYRLFPESAVSISATEKYILNEEVMQIPRAFINVKLFSNILQGIIVLMDEKVLKDIEQWLINNINGFRWDSYSYEKAKKWYGAQFSTQTEINTFPLLPDSRTDDSCEAEEDDENENNIKIRYQKNQDPKWHFLAEYYARCPRYNAKKSPYTKHKGDNKELGEKEMHKIMKVKEELVDSYPNIGLLHRLFKTCTIPSHLALQMVEIIFLKSNLAITSSLWKSVLENIKYRIRYYDKNKNVYHEIARLKAIYGNLIFEDTTTLIYQLNIFQADKKQQKEYFKQIKKSAYFLSEVDYSELIKLPGLYKEDFNQYIDNMTQYRRLLQAIYPHPRTTDTYSHFIVKCVNNYSQIKDKIGKEQKQEIIHTLQEIIKDNNQTASNNWLGQILCKGTNKNDYLNMLTDLQETCGMPTEKFVALACA